MSTKIGRLIKKLEVQGWRSVERLSFKMNYRGKECGSLLFNRKGKSLRVVFTTNPDWVNVKPLRVFVRGWQR